jgi:hypothetical protein
MPASASATIVETVGSDGAMQYTRLVNSLSYFVRKRAEAAFIRNPLGLCREKRTFQRVLAAENFYGTKITR